ncbi:MAG TPA: hypothetical protein VGP64_08295 [Polyangia bacterium]|jgi:hypothetical protein
MRLAPVAALALYAACDGTIAAPRDASPVDGATRDAPDARPTPTTAAGPSTCDGVPPGDFCLTDPPFAGVWAGAPDDVWLIESDFQQVTARHFDGRGWTTFDAGASALLAIWGSGPEDVWAVGDAGAIVHFDGTAWSPLVVRAAAGARLSAVWGSAPADVWAVGAANGAAAALHWDGQAWSAIACCGTGASAVGLTLTAVAGSGPTDVWAVGAALDPTTAVTTPVALHWDGTAFSPVAVPGTGFSLGSVFSAGAGDVWFAGGQQIFHDVGGVLTPTSIVGTVTALGGAAGQVWATSNAGGAFRWGGGGWNSVPSGTSSPLTAISASGASDLWAVGPAGTVVHGNGAGWTPLTDGTTGPLAAVWARADDDVWAGGPLRRDGVGWSHDADGAAVPASGLCGFSADDVWAVGATLGAGAGNGFIAHFDGALWTIDGIAGIYAPDSTAAPNLGPSSMKALWCHTPSDVWAVGQISVITGQVADTIAHFDGTVWSPVAAPTTALLEGVGGSAADDVWAAGVGGTLLHFDGTVWTVAPSGTSDDLGAVWGSGRDDVWVTVARQPRLLHFDGTTWTAVPSGGSGAGLTALWGSGPDDVWATGGDTMSGELLRFDGSSWSTVWTTPASVGRLTGVSGADDVLYVAAANGMVFRRTKL